MSIKFDAFRIDLEDEFRDEINRIVTKIAKEAYNKGVSDSQDAVLNIDPKCDAQEHFMDSAENAICANYVR